MYSELKSSTYKNFIEYYTDSRNLDELKNLFESKYIAQEIIDVLLKLVVHNNKYFTICFIQKEFPDLFPLNQDLSYYDFLDINKFKEYLSPLELPVKLKEPYTSLLLKKMGESNLFALYLADYKEFKENYEKIIEFTKTLRIPKTEIKDDYHEEPIDKVFL
nr:hypothetical protein [Candidatus Delongbacteria bacterium]